MQKEQLTQIELTSLLSYTQDTGELVWKENRRRVKAGDIAGSVHKKSGYVFIGVNGKVYQAHRLVWLYHYGVWPTKQMDHINGNKEDNRVENLREVSKSENQRAFLKPRSNSSSKYRGVSWDSKRCKWRSSVKDNGKVLNLGSFDCEVEAAKEYDKAALDLGFDNQALNQTHHKI